MQSTHGDGTSFAGTPTGMFENLIQQSIIYSYFLSSTNLPHVSCFLIVAIDGTTLGLYESNRIEIDTIIDFEIKEIGLDAFKNQVGLVWMWNIWVDIRAQCPNPCSPPVSKWLRFADFKK